MGEHNNTNGTNKLEKIIDTLPILDEKTKNKILDEKIKIYQEKLKHAKTDEILKSISVNGKVPAEDASILLYFENIDGAMETDDYLAIRVKLPKVERLYFGKEKEVPLVEAIEKRLLNVRKIRLKLGVCGYASKEEIVDTVNNLNFYKDVFEHYNETELPTLNFQLRDDRQVVYKKHVREYLENLHKLKK